MAGNVLKRTMSCRTNRQMGLQTSSAHLVEALKADTCQRVGKGSSFASSSEYARSAIRGNGSKIGRSTSVGFRVVRDME
jgi:formylglycine-generating enzyme required for sulfatase activity